MTTHVERLRVMCRGQWVGTLALADKSKIIFEYAPQWLTSGFDLAPRSLAFNAAAQLAKDPLFAGLHGVFNEVRDAVSQWPTLAKSNQVSAQAINAIGACLKAVESRFV